MKTRSTSGFGCSLIMALALTAACISMTSCEDDIVNVRRSPVSNAEPVASRGGQVRGRVGNRNRQRAQAQTHNDDELPYYWMCPDVRCPALPDNCEIVEFIEMEHQYDVRGKVVTVRCRSCRYCLDGPPSLATSTKRSVISVGQRSPVNERLTDDMCQFVQCPTVPNQCEDVRLTNLLLAGTNCRLCPACYDNTVVSAVSRM